MIRIFIAACLLALPAWSDTVYAARTIPARTIIAPSDIVLENHIVAGTANDAGLIIGQEARVAIYAGRPIRITDVSAPAVVERNQIIQVHYMYHGLAISTEGRALGRAGRGETVRVMNLTSRSTVTATIGDDGTAYVRR